MTYYVNILSKETESIARLLGGLFHEKQALLLLYGREAHEETWHKDDATQTRVGEADIILQEHLTEGLREFFPEDDFVREEDRTHLWPPKGDPRKRRRRVRRGLRTPSRLRLEEDWSPGSGSHQDCSCSSPSP